MACGEQRRRTVGREASARKGEGREREGRGNGEDLSASQYLTVPSLPAVKK